MNSNITEAELIALQAQMELMEEQIHELEVMNEGKDFMIDQLVNHLNSYDDEIEAMDMYIDWLKQERDDMNFTEHKIKMVLSEVVTGQMSAGLGISHIMNVLDYEKDGMKCQYNYTVTIMDESTS